MTSYAEEHEFPQVFAQVWKTLGGDQIPYASIESFACWGQTGECSIGARSLTHRPRPIRIVGSRAPKFFDFLGIFNETYLSTESTAASTYSWIPRPHADQERAHRVEAASREGPQAADCFVVAVKLRRRAEFTRVYDHGTRYRGRLMTCFALRNEAGSPRLGIAATQKIGNAVVRNRAKRLIRALFRDRKPLKDIDIVVIPRREIVDAPWRNIEADYRAALERFEK